MQVGTIRRAMRPKRPRRAAHFKTVMDRAMEIPASKPLITNDAANQGHGARRARARRPVSPAHALKTIAVTTAKDAALRVSSASKATREPPAAAMAKLVQPVPRARAVAAMESARKSSVTPRTAMGAARPTASASRTPNKPRQPAEVRATPVRFATRMLQAARWAPALSISPASTFAMTVVAQTMANASSLKTRMSTHAAQLRVVRSAQVSSAVSTARAPQIRRGRS